MHSAPRSPRRTGWTAVIALMCSAANTAHASAQSISGRLLDHESDQPIANADISLLRDDDTVAGAITGLDGAFSITDVRPGEYRLRTQHIGYQSVTSPVFRVRSEDALMVELRAAVTAVPLAPLTIVSGRRPVLNARKLEIVGFYERMSSWGETGLGFGHFLQPADLDNRRATRVSDLLRDLPGVYVEGAGGRSQTILMRSVTNISKRRCEPAIYLDGLMLRLDPGESIDALVTAESVSAIEVYPGINKPGEFGQMIDDACGALVLWTGSRY